MEDNELISSLKNVTIQEIFPPSPIWSPKPADYVWARNTVDDDIKYVTHGRLHNLPPRSSKIVRIFLSSTFTDFYAERNCLIKNVYPKLQRICKEKYDLDFQVVDMRWGIRNEASVDHSASELCMKEIHNCKRLSVGPTFVTLIGQRYGGRSLPVKILFEEMKLIFDKIKQKAEYENNLKILERWYKLDTNAIPSEYILQPIIDPKKVEPLLQDIKIKRKVGYGDNTREELDLEAKEMEEKEKEIKDKYTKLFSEGKVIWDKEEPILKGIIRSSITEALNEGAMKRENGQKFLQSITEEEIREGLLNEENTRDRCLAFIREIRGVNVKHEKAWRFVELDGEQINSETQDLLTKLRDDLVPKHLPEENIYRFQTMWSDNEGINETEHAAYLQDFCHKFEVAILNLVERAMTAKLPSSIFGNVYPEVLEHSHQCLRKVEREEILEFMKYYLLSPCDQPLLVMGESGSGKTSLMAKAASQITNWLGDDDKLVIIERFLGTTPESSSLHKTLVNVSHQLVSTLGLEDQFPLPFPQEFSDLKEIFKDILKKVPTGNRVVILLDSLDQLNDQNNVCRLKWFPHSLPSNVKLVISTMVEMHDIIQAFIAINLNKVYVHVLDLPSATCTEIMDIWFQKIKRKLTPAQKQSLGNLIEGDKMPLYLKLLFDEVSQWKSYESPTYKCLSVSSSLHQLFRKIEVKHGTTIVSNALGYLTASRDGLTELEIQHILSLDDVALTDVFEFHIPPIRRLPSILWARIKSDLNEYIVERDADGVKVMAWYHNQFFQEAHKRYVTHNYYKRLTKKSLQMHQNLADFFAGIWSDNNAKPFKYTEKQARKLKLDSQDSSAIRYVPQQPVIFKNADERIDLENIRYNKRKISELPDAVIAISSTIDMTPYIAKHIALNPEFLAAWIKHTPWEMVSSYLDSMARKRTMHAYEVVEMNRNLREKAQNAAAESCINWESLTDTKCGQLMQISAVHQCLLLCYTGVLRNPTYLGADIAGRMLQYYGVMEGITNLINYADNEGRKLCALVPPHLQRETAGSELTYTINNHMGPVSSIIWADREYNNCISVSKKIIGVDVQNGNIFIDKQPKSMPKGDRFNQVTIATDAESKQEYIFASLLIQAWVYIFDTEGEVIDIIDLTKCDPKEPSLFKISGFQVTTTTNNHLAIYAHDSSKASICCVEKVHSVGKKYQMLLFEDTNSAFHMLIACFGSEYKPRTNCTRLLLKDENHLFRLCKSDGTQLDEKSFAWPRITAVDIKHTYNSADHKIVFGFENGQLCILMWHSAKEHLRHFVPLYLLGNPTIHNYGIPHFVHHYPARNAYDNPSYFKLAIACTKTNLVVFATEDFLSKRANGFAVMNEEKIECFNDECDEKLIEEWKMKNQLVIKCRIKKQYDQAMFTKYLKFLLAVRGGTVDVFKVLDRDESIHKNKVKLAYFTTIQAHGEDIMNIMPAKEGEIFLTSSMDGSVNFYDLTKAGMIRNYVPHFDSTEQPIKDIIPGKENALTVGSSSRTIHMWDLISGKITKIFKHPKNDIFVKCAADDDMHSLVAMDKNSNVFFWSNLGSSNSAKLKAIADKENNNNFGPSDPVLQNQNAEMPVTDHSVAVKHVFPSGIRDDDIHIHVFANMFTIIATTKTRGIVLIEPISGEQFAIRKPQGPFQFVIKIKKDKILFVNNENYAYLCNVSNSDRNIAFQDSVNLSANHIDDLKYSSSTDNVIVLSNGSVSFWNVNENGSSVFNMISSVTFDTAKLLMCNTTSQCVALDFNHLQYGVIDLEEKSISYQSNLLPSQNVDRICVSPDGKYLVFTTESKDVNLVRICDGKLLAKYTMYDTVQCLNVSLNSWYILVGTSDRRLFVLLVADPDEREHDDRIKYVRSLNQSLTIPQAVLLLGDTNQFDPGNPDDYFDASIKESQIEDAEKRLQERNASTTGKDLKIIHYGDSSDEDVEDEDHDNADDVSVNLTEQNSQKQLFSVAPCSVQ